MQEMNDCNHLAATFGNKLGFKSCLADPDVWYKACIDADGNEYYAHSCICRGLTDY